MATQNSKLFIKSEFTKPFILVYLQYNRVWKGTVERDAANFLPYMSCTIGLMNKSGGTGTTPVMCHPLSIHRTVHLEKYKLKTPTSNISTLNV